MPDPLPQTAGQCAPSAQPEPAPLIRATGLGIKRGGRWLIHDIDLSVSPGEIVTLIGPNGGGKTTVLRALLGLIEPNAGEVWRRPELTVGYLPQKLHIDTTLPLTVALVLQSEGVTWLFLGPQFDESAPLVQVLFAAVAFRALTKLGDANMRALDGLTAGIAIKIAFLMAIASGVWWNLDQGHGAVGAARAVVLASVLQWLLTTVWMSVRLKLRPFPLAHALRGGLVLAAVVAVPMAALSWVWWAESTLSAGLAIAVLVWFPNLSLPQALDRQGDLRRLVGAKLPTDGLRRRWMH